MKMVLTEPRKITSKKGQDWLIFEAISPDGKDFAQIFLTPEQVQEYGLAKAAMIDLDEFKEFLSQTKPVNVEYNPLGRVDNITV